MCSRLWLRSDHIHCAAGCGADARHGLDNRGCAGLAGHDDIAQCDQLPIIGGGEHGLIKSRNGQPMAHPMAFDQNRQGVRIAFLIAGGTLHSLR